MLNRTVRIKVFLCSGIVKRKYYSDSEGYVTGKMNHGILINKSRDKYLKISQ